SRGGGGGRLRTGRGKHHAREQGRSALDQGVRSLDQGRDRSLRLSVREALTGPGAGANRPRKPEESVQETKQIREELHYAHLGSRWHSMEHSGGVLGALG